MESRWGKLQKLEMYCYLSESDVQGCSVDIAYLDFRKAFDTVLHGDLIQMTSVNYGAYIIFMHR